MGRGAGNDKEREEVKVGILRERKKEIKQKNMRKLEKRNRE